MGHNDVNREKSEQCLQKVAKQSTRQPDNQNIE